MPLSVQIGVTCFGILYFVALVAWAIHSVRLHTRRADRLEAAGIAVPGVGGLLFAGGIWMPKDYIWLAALMWLLAVGFIVLGRLVYEHIAFRRFRDGRADD